MATPSKCTVELIVLLVLCSYCDFNVAMEELYSATIQWIPTGHQDEVSHRVGMVTLL